MKNKILIVTTILLSALLGLSSCNNFIDEKPQSNFTEEGTGEEDLVSKYKNQPEAEAELLGAYNNFKNDIFQQENFMMNDVQSDNCYVGGDGTDEEYIDKIKMYATNKKVQLVWEQYMGMAGAATNVLENVRLMEEGTITQSERQRIMAEAKFIRAWAYFDMVRIWGGIPMTNQLVPTLTNDNIEEWYPIIYPERTSEEGVYEQIIKDLDQNETINHLVGESKGAFQATKGAAYGLLAKVMATKGEKSSRDYNKVVQYCDNTIGQGYQLVSNFDDLWLPDNKFTTESIFEVYYTTDSPNWAYWTLLKEGDGSVTWRRYCTPTHEFVAKFDQENDERFAASIIWKEAPYDVHYPAGSYPFSYKVREKNSEIILMRLADILLIKAEALVELNKVPEAIDIVNQIRDRAGLESSLLDRDMTQARARLAVENERQLELYMEAERWNDLVRNDRMVEVMSNHKDQNGKLLHPDIQSFRTKWPIPQSEIDKNEQLTQNEGY